MTGLLTLQKELMDDRVSSVRMPHARVPKASSLIRGDGASAFDWYPTAEWYHRQALFAEEKQKVTKEKWPFINGKYAHNIWKVPVYLGLSEVFKYAMNQTQGQPNTTTQFFNAAFRLFYSWSNQLYEANFRSSMPKIAAWNGFAGGQADIPKMFTVEVGEYEMPIFNYNPDPVKMIKANFEITRDGMVISKFNRKLGNTVKRSWLLAAAAKYTRGDYKELIDASTAKNWFAKDYTWDMQQFGPATVLGSIGTSPLKEYGKPSVIGNFIRNAIADKGYDVVDMPFDMLGPAGLGIISKITQQEFKDAEYRAIAAIRRSILQSPRKNLIYDLKVSYVQTHAPLIYTILTT